MTFVFTPLAEADLGEIVDFISEDASPDRAESVLLEILAAASRLAEHPRIGHTRADLTDEPVLFWPVSTSWSSTGPTSSRSRSCASCTERGIRVTSAKRSNPIEWTDSAAARASQFHNGQADPEAPRDAPLRANEHGARDDTRDAEKKSARIDAGGRRVPRRFFLLRNGAHRELSCRISGLR